MKTKLLLLIITTFFLTKSYSQEQCGTMQNLEFQLQKDPKLRSKLDSIEKVNELWIKNNNRGFKEHTVDVYNRSINTKNNSTLLNTNSLCGYDNTLHATINAPTTLNQIVSPTNNCINGGKFVRVNNLIAGNVYRISTISTNTFDTVLSIFSEGGGNPVAYNDDASSTITIQSEIYFNPFVSGNYDILIDQFGCSTNQLCASLQVELRYIPRPIITIPVVVHILHKGEPIGTGTNISVAQIQSQIDVLNQDFRRLNSNILSSPAPFRGTSDDPLVQFCLAQQKPDGSPSNGIVRYLEPSQQDYASWILPNGENLPSDAQCFNVLTLNYIKASTIWDRNKYLNFWVSDKLKQPPPSAGLGAGNNLGCNFESGFLGLAQFPGEIGQPSPILPDYSLTDGVWVTSTAFGNTGSVIPPYNLGRTAVHEVGHWLNLRHIWGNDEQPDPQCNVDDLVFDTPKQSESSTDCNIFPFTDSCSEFFPGIMFMNHMDYSVDNCRSIFTYGQTIRMDAALFNQRASLLTSPGCLPGSYKVVISQVYGGGGNAGATYNNDYIELFNKGTLAKNLNGWSVQYTSATGPTSGNVWFTTPLPNFTLQPGQYFLIKCAGSGTNNLPTEDIVSTISLSSTTGKVILVSDSIPETSVNPTGAQIIDKVGYGTTPNGYEGTGPTGTLLTNTTAAFRKLNGCTDTDSNPNDFNVGTPTPRNSSSPINDCSSSLSVSQNTIATVSVYPNPTHSKVFFDNSNANFKEVAIYNYLGQEVSKTGFTSISTNQEVDMSGLSAGVYILKFSNTETSQSIKVVKQ